MSEILEASNNSKKSPPSVLRKSAIGNKSATVFSTLPSTEDAKINSLGIQSKESSSIHNPWSIPSQQAKDAPIRNLSIQAGSSEKHDVAKLVSAIAPTKTAAHVNPNLVPMAQDALTKTQMQQKEAQLALQRAQYDLAKAQEQAKQAALIQEQTKRAQEQEAESAIALAKAQETARQAALLKEQTERALRAAQAGMVQNLPLQNPNLGNSVQFQNQFYSSGTVIPSANMTSISDQHQTSFSYQMPGSVGGMIMGGSGPAFPMQPARSALQTPLIPVGSLPTKQIRPQIAQSAQNTAYDPYAVFKNVNANEPSIFTSSTSGKARFFDV